MADTKHDDDDDNYVSNKNRRNLKDSFDFRVVTFLYQQMYYASLKDFLIF